MIKERRKHPRLHIPLEAEYLVAGEEEWRQGTIWTLGAGGAALLCEQKLAHGTVLEGLHFVVEAEGDLPETRIEVSAEVVSLDRKDDFGRSSNFMLGLQFSGLGEQEFELLKQFVFRRLTNPKRPSAIDEAEPTEKTGAPPIEIRFKLFDEFVEEVSENLSPSGMFIRAHRPLPPGSRFVFQFQLGEDFSLFHGTAEVVWTRRRSEGPDQPSGMGVRFLNLDLTSQKLVKRLVGERDVAPEDGVGEAGDEPRRRRKGTLELPADAEPFPIAAASAARPVAADGAPLERAGESAAEQARTRKRLEQLEKRLGDMESARAEAEERALRLAAEAEALGEEVGSLRSSRDEAEEASKRAEAEAAEAEEARKGAEAEAAELQQEVETLQQDDELDEKLRRASEELESRREEWKSLEAELRADLGRDADSRSELQKELEAAGETEAELRRSLESASETETELRSELQQMEENRDDLERLAEKAADAEDRLQMMRQELADSSREWDATEAELRAQLDQHSTEKAKLEERVTEVVGAEAELLEQLSDVRGAHDELKESLAQSAQVEAVLREQAQELRQGRDDSVAKLTRATKQLGRMRGAAEEMKSRFNGDLGAAQELGVDLANKLAEVAGVGAGLDKKVKSLTAARTDLAERLTRINEAWSSLEGGLEEVELEEADPVIESLELPMLASMTSAGEEAEALEEVETLDELEPAEQLESAEELEFVEEPQSIAAEERQVEPEGAAEGESEVAPEPLVAAVEMPDDEPVEVPVAASDEPSAAASEAAESTAGLESDGISAEEQPAPTGAARLVGVARRAVARLGFARKTAGNGRNGGSEAESDVPILEAKTEAVVADELPGPAAIEEPGPVAIEETVKAWAAAWSERRVEDYLSFYSQEFEPIRPDEQEETGEAAHAWLPPMAGMQLTLGPISRTEMAPGRFAVQFEQSVESDTYTRRTGRTLEMVLEADAWKIAAESFQDLPN